MKEDHAQRIARRRLLVGGATGVALAAWHKPVIQSVLLPAHAQMSAPTVFSVAGISGGPLIVQRNSILDYLIPVAHAGKPVPVGATLEFTIRAEDISGDLSNFSVGLFTRVLGFEGYDKIESVHQGNVSVASGGELIPTQVPCNAIDVLNIDAEIVQADGGQFSLRLLGIDLVLDAPPADIPLPTAVCVEAVLEVLNDFDSIAERSSERKLGKLLDAIVPVAMAIPNGSSTPLIEDLIAINSGDGSSFDVSYQDGSYRWSGNLLADGTLGSLDFVPIAGCGTPMETSINAKINSVVPSGLNVQVNGPSNPMAVFNLDPAVSPVLPDLECADVE